MIIQITRTKNELFLLKELLPIWQKYADGFVFYDDFSSDGTFEFLTNNKDKYNIVEILRPSEDDDYIKKLKIETDARQLLYDTALKFSNKIICCDSDEYLDGSLSKQQLELFFDENPDTIFSLQWVQYTSKDKIRVDGPWDNNFKVRAGNYKTRGDFGHVQMHSLHLPPAGKVVHVNPAQLFIAHLQWIDKRWVGVKQYFWKINDYVNSHIHNASVVECSAYDVSVNNFNWCYKQAPVDLKVDELIYSKQNIRENYKLQYIKHYTNQLNIPNLGDWGMGIHTYCLQHD
jgi:hypothetical protein